MRKIVFIPFSVFAGLLAGFTGKAIFGKLWGAIDEEEPPEAEHRHAPWGKVLLAAALQGAIFRVTKTAVDRGARRAWLGLTGAWPGEEEPETEG